MTDTLSSETATLERGRWGSPAPERVGALEGIRRHPLLTVLPLIVLLIAAAVYGLVRTPTYTAQTRLSVGRIDVSAPGALAGYALATQSLASAYSRAIDAQGVTVPLAQRFHMTQKEVENRLSATPIPQSPLFTVQATGGSARDAIRLANAASDQLRTYIVGVNRNNPDGPRLLAQYNQAAQAVSAQQLVVDRIRRRNNGDLSASDRRELASAQATLAALTLRAQTISQNYRASQQSEASAALVQQLTAATSATSDRGSRLQIALFIAAVAGIIIGIALATLRANRRSHLAYR